MWSENNIKNEQYVALPDPIRNTPPFYSVGPTSTFSWPASNSF